MAPSCVFLSFIISHLLIIVVVCQNCAVYTPEEDSVYDFTKCDDVQNWQEQSDTVRSVGMSKATLSLFENKENRRAILFVLINPQPDHSGFAGVYSLKSFNLTKYTGLEINCRGQGKYHGYKIILRYKGLSDNPYYTFEQYFEAPKDEFKNRTLPFSKFAAYYRGELVNETIALDTSQITSVGIQMYGGVYLPKRQEGPATLEINWIKAV